MISPAHTKLTIHLEQPAGEGIDDTGTVTTTITCDTSDCSVHAYFNLFQRVLACAGFCEESIMKGGAQLAFNEYRSVDLMRKVAAAYDLKLIEDLDTTSDDSDRAA